MNIPEISLNQHYWFVRTHHGEFYDDFVHGNFVGVGWNAVTPLHLKDNKDHDEILQELVIEEDPDIKRSAWAINQIRRFVADISIGDIMIVPSENSRYLSFGRVMSDVYEEDVPNIDLMEGACPYRKRRRIDWFKTVKRTELDPYLYRLFYSHHVVTDAGDYAPYIDRTLHSFFRKGDVYYMVIRITEPGLLRGRILPNFLSALLDIIPMFNRQMGTDFPEDDVAFKLNIQSPGFIELIIPEIGILLGILAVFLGGGDISGKLSKDEISGNIKTPGIFKALMEFQEAKQRRQISNEMMQLNDNLHSLSEQIGAVYPSELEPKSTPPHESGSSDDSDKNL